MLFAYILPVLTSFLPLVSCTTSTGVQRQISIDASSCGGKLKYTQNSNFINDDTLNNDAIAKHWQDSHTAKIFIYLTPDNLFLGWNETGSAGDPTRLENYNLTQINTALRRITAQNKVGLVQFQDDLGKTYGTPALMEAVGYFLANYYGNGAHGSGFYNALELIDFYPEPDSLTVTLAPASVLEHFALLAGFVKGVQRASSFVGVGAWSVNRVYIDDAVPVNPYNLQFFQYIKKQNIPLRAITVHTWTPTSEVLPQDVSTIRQALDQAGLPNMPIWVTEYARNPAPTAPTTEPALSEYNSRALCNAFIQSAQIYAQDAPVDEIFPWPGISYGFYGAGDAYFEEWYNSTTGAIGAIGAGWLLSGQFLSQTRNRLTAKGFDNNGFAGLAASSDDKTMFQVLISNYHVPNDVLQAVNKNLQTIGNATLNGPNPLNAQGLWNSEFLTYGSPAPPGLGLSFPKPAFNVNNVTSYALQIQNLPWQNTARFNVTIQRVSDANVQQVVLQKVQSGCSLSGMDISMPANSVDLITLQRI